jgi:hypothetical protein
MDMLLKRIRRLVKRRQVSPKELDTRHAPRADVRGAQGALGAKLVIWESELRAIAAETSVWTIETGGDLFGRWRDVPVVYLATKAGPKAIRDTAHFRLDVDYLRQLSDTLASDWGLRYFGDWHSHHRLRLTEPSSGDRRRICGLGRRNQFASMAEIIVTVEDSERDQIIRIHPWLYDLSGDQNNPTPLSIKVLRGLSPIRQALLASGTLPEQQFASWQKIPFDCIRIGDEKSPPALEPPTAVDATTRDKTLAKLASALQAASTEAIEQHRTGFGYVLVAKLREPHYVGFALSADWPLPVLEVHRLNRDTGSNESLPLTAALTASDIPAILEIYRAAKAGLNGAADVDR